MNTDNHGFEDALSRWHSAFYSHIEDALRNQYSIGFTPEPRGVKGQYRKIKPTTKKAGLIAQTRDGYYSKRSAASAMMRA